MCALLLRCYHNLQNILQNELSKSKNNTEVVVLFYCSAKTKLSYMPECKGDRLEHSISVVMLHFFLLLDVGSCAVFSFESSDTI